jgi:hypothetical protein
MAFLMFMSFFNNFFEMMNALGTPELQILIHQPDKNIVSFKWMHLMSAFGIHIFI